MTDENTPTTEQKGEDTPKTDTKPVSIVDEARAIRDEIRQEREKLEKANAESRELQATKLLSGDTVSEPTKDSKEESPVEYRDRIDKEISEGKHVD